MNSSRPSGGLAGAAGRPTRQPSGVPGLAAGDVLEPDLDLRLQVELAAVEGHDAPRRPTRTLGPHPRRSSAWVGEVVEADDHVLGRAWSTGLPSAGFRMLLVDSIRIARLGLRLGRQRQVHGHLVAVEVGVERRADERVDLDGLALDQLRLEGLDAQAVQGRRAVQQHRVLA